MSETGKKKQGEKRERKIRRRGKEENKRMGERKK